ncbi:hypothetical protein PR202_gb15495 [Eleusine coracana subsp. coracana]|uniref:Transcription repressor n=1 Tax=Eleusine coracana subsp. coracana TaxID=191504 RepID=A0AAV5EXA6_ELECO|nr:hypothetical protein QOZ80_4BG0347040 [Eleusine coracana subsp. coracana]GJN27467.1 hypothetical protein PR202_gb15495 [Eleusine coracana subsp. coracana]
MQLFSGRGKEHKSGGGGRKYQAAATMKEETMTTTTQQQQQHRGGSKCRALCCGASRLSVSSSASCSSADAAPRDLLPPRGLSNKLDHGMVQERLQSMMIDAGRTPRVAPPEELVERRHRRRPSAWGAASCYESSVVRSGREAAAVRRTTCVVLLAEDRRTHDPMEEFRRSIAEVIAAKRMAEPAELRALLNCYVSVNAREHRAAILEAFHEVCSGLFSSCKQLC